MSLLPVVLGAYLVGLFALSVYSSSRVHNEEDYIVAGRQLPLWLAWGTLLATWFGAATILGAAEAARDEGMFGTVLDPFASGAALMVAGWFFARPLWDMKLLTMGDFYARKFGPRAEILASVLLVPGYFGWVAAQYLALAQVQSVFFGIPLETGICLAAGLVLIYTMTGGMWSVTLTDTAQMFVVLVTLVVLAWVTFSHLGNGNPADGVVRLIEESQPGSFTLLPAATSVAILGWLSTWGAGVFGNIPGQDLMQRVFASNSSATAGRACVFAGVIYILFGLLPVGMGLASRILVPESNGQEILGVLAQEFLGEGMKTVFVVSLVSIIVSTCTSAVLSPASIIAHNLVGRVKSLASRKLLVDRAAVILVTALSVTVAFSGQTILDLLELSVSTVLVSLFVPLAMGLYGRRRTEAAAIGGMLAGMTIWCLREALERFWLPLPHDSSLDYHAYVLQTLQGREWPAWSAAALSYFALLPSGVSGTLSSFAVYLAGTRFGRNLADDDT